MPQKQSTTLRPDDAGFTGGIATYRNASMVSSRKMYADVQEMNVQAVPGSQVDNKVAHQLMLHQSPPVPFATELCPLLLLPALLWCCCC